MLELAPNSNQAIVDNDYEPSYEENAALEMPNLLGLPYEMQILILSKLIPEPEFISYFMNYAASARLPQMLVKDPSFWFEVANYWLHADNLSRLSLNSLSKALQMIAQVGKDKLLDLLDPDYDKIYHTNGKALLAAASVGDQHSIDIFIDRLAPTKYPHYIGEALRIVASSGEHDLSERLLEVLLRKNSQGRDRFISLSCSAALANSSWDIVMTLLNKLDPSKDTILLGEAVLKAGKDNLPTIVQMIVNRYQVMLAFSDKWALKSLPGFQNSGLTVDDLFANQYWFIRAPLTICLHQLGYPSLAATSVAQEAVDVDAVSDLLSGLSIGNQEEAQQERQLKMKFS